MGLLIKELKEIITENCILRRIEVGDANTIFEIFSSPDVIRYWDHVAWKNLSEATRFIQGNALQTRTY